MDSSTSDTKIIGAKWSISGDPKQILRDFADHRIAELYKKEPKPLFDDFHDPVNHPKHYTEHPSGIECIQITRHMGFNLGNALKYIWRCDLKKDAIEDLKKAIWYLQDEIKMREGK